MHNGLILSKIKTSKEVLNVVNSIKETVEKYIKRKGCSFIVAYMDYTVLIGKYENGSFVFARNLNLDENYIQKLRIFNEEEEIYIFRDRGVLKGRYINDTDGDETDVVDACQILWGTSSEPANNGFTKIYEDRGTELYIPIKNIEIDNHKSRIAIKTRNYIGYLPTNQATYVDCRFIGFETFHQGE